MCEAVIAKNWPTFPSGVQAQIAIRPPGFITRAISPAVGPMVGREHAAEDRDHRVEALVLERELLGVALDPFDLDAGVGRLRLPPPRAASVSRSRPVTSAPVFAAGIVALPAPQADVEDRSSPLTAALSTAFRPASAISSAIAG